MTIKPREEGVDGGIEVSGTAKILKESTRRNEGWTEEALKELNDSGEINDYVFSSLRAELSACGVTHSDEDGRNRLTEAAKLILDKVANELTTRNARYLSLLEYFGDNPEVITLELVERSQETIDELRKNLEQEQLPEQPGRRVGGLIGPSRPKRDRYSAWMKHQLKLARELDLPSRDNILDGYISSACAAFSRAVYGVRIVNPYRRTTPAEGRPEHTLEQEALQDGFQNRYYDEVKDYFTRHMDHEENIDTFVREGRLVALSPREFADKLTVELVREMLYGGGELSDWLDSRTRANRYEAESRDNRKSWGHRYAWRNRESRNGREHRGRQNGNSGNRKENEYGVPQSNTGRLKSGESRYGDLSEDQKRIAFDVSRIFDGLRMDYDKALVIKPQIEDIVMRIMLDPESKYSGGYDIGDTPRFIRAMVIACHPDRGGDPELSKIIGQISEQFKRNNSK